MAYNNQQPAKKQALVHQPAKRIDTSNALAAMQNPQDFFPPDKYTVIKPVQMLMPQTVKGMKPDIKVLDLRDHFYNQQGKKAMLKTGIEMLADAYECNITELSSKIIRGEYVEFKFEASMIRNGVTLMKSSGTQAIDVKTEEEEILLKLEDEALDGKAKWQAALKGEYKEGHLYKMGYDRVLKDRGHWERVARYEVLRVKKHMVRMCESKAKLAALRGLLTIPQTFSEEDTLKPFVVFRLEPDYSEMSPSQIEALRAQATRSAEMLTGQPLEAPPLPKNTEVIDAGFEELSPDEEREFSELHEVYVDADFGDVLSEQTQEEAEPQAPQDRASQTVSNNHGDGAIPPGHKKHLSGDSSLENVNGNGIHQPELGTVQKPCQQQNPAQNAPVCCKCGGRVPPGVANFCASKGWQPTCMKCQGQ